MKVVLTVLDVNDNEPAFVNQPYHALVPVSAEKGHLVLQVRKPITCGNENEILAKNFIQ